MHNDPKTVNIALLGAAGRMGRAIIETAHDYSGVHISAALVQAGSPMLNRPASDALDYSADLDAALRDSDVLLDFATPDATSAALDACIAARKPLVIGVTGMDAVLQQRIERAGSDIAVLTAANMSLGVNLLLQLARSAAVVLDAGFDIEILEAHHQHKKDAPSGTALALGETLAAARGVKLETHAVYDRAGKQAARQPGSIGFSSIRAGDIVGDHTVLFAGPGERLELVHRAESRAAFARGALAAARWLAGKPAGRYGMADVLGLLSAG
ncbi:MAG TPA: 4-hydroxy-tetrahydrodipicolinate reductase [Gammaproteobacteria bacterium]|nr:4-hydroxy-tetrahydrodipicolinate reductase [Gammaproteobacteria bacterium]